MVTCYRSAALDKETRTRHGFFTAQGSLDPVALKFGTPELITVDQWHSPDVVVLTDTTFSSKPRADAIVTKRLNMAIGVITADCGPVLFSDAEAGVIGAAHAGWRGAINGILENTIDMMVRQGARIDRIAAALGPCIHQESYQVTAEMRDTVLTKCPNALDYFVDDSTFELGQRYLFDLGDFIIFNLRSKGMRTVDRIHQDTYSNRLFHSYRRATHQGVRNDGRQFSVITLKSQE